MNRLARIRQFLVARRFTLFEQFLMISFTILLSGMLIIGGWVTHRIESAAINQTANVTALYMNSFVAPLLQPLTTHDTLDTEQHHALQRLVINTPLGRDIVALRVWAPNGTVLFSLTPSQIGARFSLNEDLRTALRGQTVSHLSALDKAENTPEREFWATLIETYVPVRAAGTDRVIAVAEFYQLADALIAQIQTAQRESWLVVGVATMAMYALLSGIFARGSRTIERQQEQLQQSVDNLAALLKENRALHQRVQNAAARASQINEQFLARIGRDLHDGPAQDLALALLRLDELFQGKPIQADTMRMALQSALHEIRTLAAGLQLPELEPLSTPEVARRAVREFQHKTSTQVELALSDALPALSLPKKIALYRVIVEALNNAFRHAGAKDMRVRLWCAERHVYAEIGDTGPGFDPTSISRNGDHLGLAGLQQRITLLAGTFEIQSEPGAGTRIRVGLPLKEEEP